MSESAKTPPKTVERAERKVREGLVVSDKMDKTIVVSLEDRVKHRMYGKVIRRTSKVNAHDEANSAGVGDRPCSCPSVDTIRHFIGSLWIARRRASRAVCSLG